MNDQNLALEEVANGVISRKSGKFYPYKRIQVTTAATSANPQSNNSRFYIAKAQIMARTVAGDTTTVCYWSSTVRGTTGLFACVYLLPLTAQTLFATYPSIGLLCDAGTAITITNDAAPTAAGAVLIVAEVDE